TCRSRRASTSVAPRTPAPRPSPCNPDGLAPTSSALDLRAAAGASPLVACPREVVHLTMQVDLVSPERILWSGEADMVVCRTTDGDIAFLSNHAPFIGALDIGLVKIEEPGGQQTRFAVHGGFVEVSRN